MKIKKLLGIGPAPRRRRPAVSDKELRAGLTVRSRYVLRELLGNGAFGEVWLAIDKLTEMQVALKFFLSVDGNSMDEFVKEFTLLGGISHPNILSALHFDKWGTRPFVVMKYCPGGTASNLRGSISEPMLWRLIHDVASGLAFLQSRPVPIVHQDLKPSNILIDEAGNFMLSDFGLSKKIETVIMKMSMRAIGGGSLPYMGPERFHSDRLPVLASDIWSLGVSIYELATGELPFGCGVGPIRDNMVNVPTLDGNWSDDLNRLMQACLSIETWDRPKASDIVSIARRHLWAQNDNELTAAPDVRPDVKPIVRPRINEAVAIPDSFSFIDLGLSVKWSECFWGAKDSHGLGMSLPNGSPDIMDRIPCGKLPAISQIRELVERCAWRPRKLGRTIVGYDVVGPNGMSIYIPFVEVQSSSEKVSRAKWRAMEKAVYFPSREDVETYGNPCKCMVDANGGTITTSKVVDSLHFRLVADRGK